MKFDFLMNSAEKQKRKWLKDVITENSNHKFIYFPMLSDTHEGRMGKGIYNKGIADKKRALIFQHFCINMQEHFYGYKKVFGYNATDLYTKSNWKQYTQDFINQYKAEDDGKDVIIFTDPDTGLDLTNTGSLNDKKYINAEMIKMLMEAISDNSKVICYQYVYNGNNEHKNRTIYNQLSTYFKGSGIRINDDAYQTGNLKFYIFYKSEDELDSDTLKGIEEIIM